MQEIILRSRSPAKGRRSADRHVRVDQSTVLGVGGEGAVHKDPDHPRSRAIKIYHQPSERRGSKVNWFVESDLGFPERILAPDELALSTQGKIVGFGMPQLTRQYTQLSALFDGTFCQDNGITGKGVAELFLNIGADLRTIHSKCSVGDLNDGGILFTPGDDKPVWVDVDSWNVDGFPCQVGTQLYLCPALFGLELQTGAFFKPWHDDYSFAVLLFRALLRKHPFKAGIHPELRSVLARAEKGVTVLDKAVTYPPAGLKPEILSNELTDALLKHLKLQAKGDFPLDTLRAYRDQLGECKSCGVWYPTSRKQCPQCATTTIAQVSVALGVTVLELIESRGRVLYVQVVGSTIYCFAEEDGTLVLYRRDASGAVRQDSLGLAYDGRMRFGVFGETLVISVDNDAQAESAPLYLLEVTQSGVRPIKQLSTNVFAGKAPVFATSRRYLYRLAGNYLMRAALDGANVLEDTVCDAFQNQTWFTCDPKATGGEAIIGMHRDVARMDWFLSCSDAAGKQFKTHSLGVVPLEPHESLVDACVRFSGGSALLVRRTRKSGAELVRLERINCENGTINSSSLLPLLDHPHWERIHGVAFGGKVVMIPTDNGIVRINLDTNDVQPLSGTQSISSPDDRLMVHGQEILTTRHHAVSLIKKA